MSKFDIRPQFECQNRISNVKNLIFGPSSNVKIGFRMSKCDIRSKFECQKRILNVKIRYLARIRMSKKDFEYQNVIFGPSSNNKIGF